MRWNISAAREWTFIPTVNFGAGTYLFGNSAGDTCPIADGQSTCLDIGHGSTLATASAGALLYIESGGADISTDSPTSLLGSSSYDGIAVWDASASGTKDPLNIQNGGRSTTTLGGIYVPNGETDITGDGTVNATFLATNTAILANGQIGLG